MGWDCSYHLVDPAAIKQAITKLVAGKPAPAELLEHHEEGAQLWAEAQRRVLDEPDPEIAAALACQLAIAVAASSLPHRRERGVAFSFGWDPSERRLGVRLFGDLSESPEPMFAALLKRRPELAGRFHTAFESNGDTGVFIPAKHVAAAAEQLRRARFDVDEALRPRFDEQLATLYAAARWGYAYWEATDLAVPQTRPELLRLLHEDFELIEGPTLLDTLDSSSVTLADGTMLIYELDKGLFRQPPGAERELIARLGTQTLVAGKRGALLVPHFRSLSRRAMKDTSGLAKPQWSDGATLRPIAGFPDLVPGRNGGKTDSNAVAATGAVRLGDGTPIAIWNGDAYEVEDGELGPRWPLGIDDMRWVCHRYLPWDEDGFYYCDRKTLRRVRRGHAPEDVAVLRDELRAIEPGPEGSVIVLHRELRLKFKRVATIVLPDAGEEIELRHGTLRGYRPGDFFATYHEGYVWGIEDRGWGKQDRKVFRCPPDAFLAGKRSACRKP